MKGNKSILLATAMLAGLAATEQMGRSKSAFIIDDDEEPFIPPKKPIPAGCKEYTFYGVTVIALNEKSAIKKCKKKAGIK